jgi:hypothetical protein
MKKKKVLIVFLISLSFIYILPAQSWHPEITHRPRLVLLESEIETIRARLSEGVYNQLWSNDYTSRKGAAVNGIYQKAGEERAVSPNTEETPRAYADVRAWIAKHAAFAYTMNKRANGIDALDEFTGDSDPHPRDWYKDHALEYLQTIDPVVLGPADLGELGAKAKFVDNWQWRTKELINYCQAYDMLVGADVLVPDTVKTLLDLFAHNLYQKYTSVQSIPPLQSLKYYLVSKNNHRLMIAAALGQAAVTLNDSEHAGTWIQLAMGVIQYVLFENGDEAYQGLRQVDSDGGYAEGPYYLKYVLKHLIPFFIAMRNFNGDWTEVYTYEAVPRSTQSPWFDPEYQKIYDWITKIRMPEGRLPALEDSYQDHYLPDLAVFGSIHGYYSWPYQSFDDQLSKEALLNQQLTDPFDLRIEYVVAGYTAEAEVPPDWDNVQVMSEAGSAVFRSDWGTEAIYLHLYGQHDAARESGSTHDHADVTSFILGYMGQVLALDAGYIKWDHHYSVNKPENHNLILVDGYGPIPPSGPVIRIPTIYNAPSLTDGSFTTTYIAADFSYVDVATEYGRHYEMTDSLDRQEVWEYIESDITEISMTRGVLFIDNRYFVICDDLDNLDNDKKSYQYLLHGNGGGTSGGTYELINNGAVWTRNNVKLTAQITALNGGINFSDSLYTHGDGFNTIKTHTCLQATKEAVDTKYLSVLFPGESDHAANFFEQSNDTSAGFLVDRDPLASEGRYDFIFTQKDQDSLYIPEQTIGSMTIKSIHTDAELLVISFDKQDPDNPESMKIFGKSISYLTYDDGFFIFEPDSSTTSNFSIITGTPANVSRVPMKYTLAQNHPNPFNPKTIISYQLAGGSDVELSVYNLLGQKVATVVKQKQASGVYQVEWDASLYASGIYYYKIVAGEFRAVKKMILLK